jgi:hypothetical protein
MRPKSIKCVRPDGTAIICADCPDAKEGILWAEEMRYSYALIECDLKESKPPEPDPYKVDRESQWIEARSRALAESVKTDDPIAFFRAWEIVNPKP